MIVLLLCSLLGARIVGAAISEKCSSQTSALKSNSALYAPGGGCLIGTGEDSCEFDFSTVSSAFQTACVSLGAYYYEEDIAFDCPQYGKVYWMSYPKCFSSACSEQEAIEYYDTFLIPDFEEQVGTLGFSCNAIGEDHSAGIRSALSIAAAILTVTMAFASFIYC